MAHLFGDSGQASAVFILMITHEELLALYEYDPASGFLKSRVRRNALRPGQAVGCPNERGYLRTTIHRKHYFIHRLAWFYVYKTWPAMLDHINGNCSDNRIANLRLCDEELNGRNRKRSSNNSTGKAGVSYDSRDGKYFAAIKVKGVTIQLGRYDCFDDARDARIAGEKKYFKHFRREGA